MRIQATVLTNDSTLRGPAAPSPTWPGTRSCGGRRTDADWTHVIPVGDVITATIDLSKDNVQFGVRAVDRDGHRSPVAAPSPV